eukprot:726898-Pelagomonas_calceolata.AAC.1
MQAALWQSAGNHKLLCKAKDRRQGKGDDAANTIIMQSMAFTVIGVRYLPVPLPIDGHNALNEDLLSAV